MGKIRYNPGGLSRRRPVAPQNKNPKNYFDSEPVSGNLYEQMASGDLKLNWNEIDEIKDGRKDKREIFIYDANLDFSTDGKVSRRIPINRISGDVPIEEQHNDYETGVTERAYIGPSHPRGSGYSPLMESMLSGERMDDQRRPSRYDKF
jgi:hypothetical protein